MGVGGVLLEGGELGPEVLNFLGQDNDDLQ